MITPVQIKEKALRKYSPYLNGLLRGIEFEEIIISFNKSHKNLSLTELDQLTQNLISESKIKKNFGYQIEFKDINTKNLSLQSLPQKIYFSTETDFLKFLGKEKEVQDLKNKVQLIKDHIPELSDWIINNPKKIIQESNWNDLLKVCAYFKENPTPHLYIRELPIQVHSKFIETHQGIIKELLEILIKDYVNWEENHFTKRFNLKQAEALIRFRILDIHISQQYFNGLEDLSIPLSAFEQLNLPIKNILIVENKTSLYTALTLPKITNTLVIFGSGFAANNLKNATWLNNMNLLYWGDLDTHGFEILSQFRQHFPHVKSVLMDEETFNLYFENDLGKNSKNTQELNLTDAEQHLYQQIKYNNWRLEQEKIPYAYVNQILLRQLEEG